MVNRIEFRFFNCHESSKPKGTRFAVISSVWGLSSNVFELQTALIMSSRA